MSTPDRAREFIAAMESLADREPLDRASHARRLSDEALAVLAAIGDEAVWEATRPRGELTRREAAVALGVSEAAIGKAVRLHNARQKALTERTESGARKRTKKAQRA